MKIKNLKMILLTFVMMLACFAMTGCTDEVAKKVQVEPSSKVLKIKYYDNNLVVRETTAIKVTTAKDVKLLKTTYKSSNTAVATVSPKGLVRSIKPGTATITVTGVFIYEGERYTKDYTCKITVRTSDMREKYVAYRMRRQRGELTSVKGTQAGAVLSWKEGNDVDGYVIYRKGGNTTSYKPLKVIAGTDVLTYTDTAAAPNTAYFYCIRSYCKVGSKIYYSGYSKAVGIRVPVLENVKDIRLSYDDEKNTIEVKWDANEDAHGYMIYRSTSRDRGYRLVQTVKNSELESFTDGTIGKRATDYYYIIKSYKKVGGRYYVSAYSAPVHITVER